MSIETQEYGWLLGNSQIWPRNFDYESLQSFSQTWCSHYAGQQCKVKRRQLGLEQVWWSEGSVWCPVPVQQIIYIYYWFQFIYYILFGLHLCLAIPFGDLLLIYICPIVKATWFKSWMLFMHELTKNYNYTRLINWSMWSRKCSQMNLHGILLHRSLNYDTNRPRQKWPEHGNCVLSFCWGSMWLSWLLDGWCHQLTPIDWGDQITSWGCLRRCQSSGHVAVGDHFVV